MNTHTSTPSIIKQSGFTLIEMMVVVVIMAIIASIAVPKFSKLISEQALQEGASKIVSIFNQARSQAALSGRNTTLTFSATNTTPYTMTVVTTADNTTLQQYTLNERTDVTSAIVNFTVHSNGTLDSNPALPAPIPPATSANYQFDVCDNNFTGERGYRVLINALGMARVERIVCA